MCSGSSVLSKASRLEAASLFHSVFKQGSLAVSGSRGAASKGKIAPGDPARKVSTLHQGRVQVMQINQGEALLVLQCRAQLLHPNLAGEGAATSR